MIIIVKSRSAQVQVRCSVLHRAVRQTFVRVQLNSFIFVLPLRAVSRAGVLPKSSFE